MSDDPVKKKKKKKLPGSYTEEGDFFGSVRDYLVLIAIALGIALLVVHFVAVRSVVDGNSMNPTLNNGDSLVVGRIQYVFSGPKRFDIVVFELKDDPGTHYIKRIIGLPGETVQIREGAVYINGELLSEDVYGNAKILRPGRAYEPLTLGEGEYFVLGDNRNNSQDSRYIAPGNIAKSQIVGKAFLRIWPFSSFGPLGEH
ncbi:MAG: signal peptidase I [Lachnospiraceae bacterium]|nr:signal peptidase I [Lachnospiraceae bacterium]